MDCGVLDHDPSCLCDVRITHVAPISTLALRAGYYLSEVMQVTGASAPFSNRDLIDIFSMQVEIKDRLAIAERMTLGGTATGAQKSSLPYEVREHIAYAVAADTPSGAIRAEVKEKWGIEISPSHMSHLRKRLLRSADEMAAA